MCFPHTPVHLISWDDDSPPPPLAEVVLGGESDYYHQKYAIYSFTFNTVNTVPSLKLELVR